MRIQKKVSVLLSLILVFICFKLLSIDAHATDAALTPVTITGSFPVSDSNGVSIGTSMSIRFGSNIFPGKDYEAITLKNESGNNVDTLKRIEGDTLTVTPAKHLEYETKYTLVIPLTAVKSESGSALAKNHNISFTTGKEYNWFAGNDRYDTNIKIVHGGWYSSYYAVLVTGEVFPDALCAAPLAAKYGAPILLTRPDSLSPKLEAEINRLKVKEIFIVGGTGVISQQIEDSLRAKDIKCTRLWGNTRYDTSVAIANHIGKSTHVFIATGENFPDALSVASYAAFKQMPILLTERDNLPDSARKYISDNNIKNAYIIGGFSAVSQDIESNFNWVHRLEGKNRYETNMKILTEFEKEFNFTDIYFASGEDFPDALSGSALAALTGSPMIFLDNGIDGEIINYLKGKSALMKMKYIFSQNNTPLNSLIDSIFN